MSSMLFCMMAFAGSAGFYMLLAGQLSRNELLTGGMLGIVFTILVSVLHLGQERRLRLPMPPAHLFLKPAAALLLDSGRVGRVLLRAIRHRPSGALGSIAAQPFRQGEQPHDRGRRALVILASSLAPNGYVLDPQPGGEALLLHRLAASPPADDDEWPA